jgi:hypothetical protein
LTFHSGYRINIIHLVPQIRILDTQEVTEAERNYQIMNTNPEDRKIKEEPWEKTPFLEATQNQDNLSGFHSTIWGNPRMELQAESTELTFYPHQKESIPYTHQEDYKNGRFQNRQGGIKNLSPIQPVLEEDSHTFTTKQPSFSYKSPQHAVPPKLQQITKSQTLPIHPQQYLQHQNLQILPTYSQHSPQIPTAKIAQKRSQNIGSEPAPPTLGKSKVDEDLEKIRSSSEDNKLLQIQIESLNEIIKLQENHINSKLSPKEDIGIVDKWRRKLFQTILTTKTQEHEIKNHTLKYRESKTALQTQLSNALQNGKIAEGKYNSLLQEHNVLQTRLSQQDTQVLSSQAKLKNIVNIINHSHNQIHLSSSAFSVSFTKLYQQIHANVNNKIDVLDNKVASLFRTLHKFRQFQDVRNKQFTDTCEVLNMIKKDLVVSLEESGILKSQLENMTVLEIAAAASRKLKQMKELDSQLRSELGSEMTNKARDIQELSLKNTDLDNLLKKETGKVDDLQKSLMKESQIASDLEKKEEELKKKLIKFEEKYEQIFKEKKNVEKLFEKNLEKHEKERNDYKEELEIEYTGKKEEIGVSYERVVSENASMAKSLQQMEKERKEEKTENEKHVQDLEEELERKTKDSDLRIKTLKKERDSLLKTHNESHYLKSGKMKTFDKGIDERSEKNVLLKYESAERGYDIERMKEKTFGGREVDKREERKEVEERRQRDNDYYEWRIKELQKERQLQRESERDREIKSKLHEETTHTDNIDVYTHNQEFIKLLDQTNHLVNPASPTLQPGLALTKKLQGLEGLERFAHDLLQDDL